MKNLLVLFCFVCALGSLRAQIFVNGVNINDPDAGVKIISVNIVPGAWFIQLPGPPMKGKDRNEQEISDANGQKPEIATDVNVFNFLELNGWELLFETTPAYMGAKTYLFRRRE